MTLETGRLILRHWQDSDAERLYELASDPLVGPAAGWEPHKSVEESLDIIRTVFNSDEIYAILLRETGELIGCDGFMFHDSLCRNRTEALLGYWIGTPYWGHGYITEATRRLITHAFEDLHLSGLWCGNFVENTRSARVQQKCGFVFHHTEHSAHWSEDTRETTITYLDLGASLPK